MFHLCKVVIYSKLVQKTMIIQFVIAIQKMTKKILINVNQNLLNATVMVIAMTICAMAMENVFCSRKRLKKVVYVIFPMRENFVRVHGFASTMKGLVKRLGNEILNISLMIGHFFVISIHKKVPRTVFEWRKMRFRCKQRAWLYLLMRRWIFW